MSKSDRQLIAELEAVLTSQHYSPAVIRNYCAYADEFLDCLTKREIPVAQVAEAQVVQYLQHAILLFRKRRGRLPAPRWHEIARSGIHALLRLVQVCWFQRRRTRVRGQRAQSVGEQRGARADHSAGARGLARYARPGRRSEHAANYFGTRQ